MRLCLLIPLISIVALSISPRATQAFMARSGEADWSYTLMRFLSPLDETLGVLPDGPVLGTGIGTTHPSAVTIMGADFPWWLNGLFTEGEMARVTEELGLIGLVLIYFLRFLIAAFALRCTRTFKDPAYRALGIVFTVNLAMGLTGGVMLNATAGLYYWGSFGLVLTMRGLEQSADRKFGKVLVRGAEQTTNLKPVIRPSSSVLKADNSNEPRMLGGSPERVGVHS